jgi:hypothetical protein
MLIAIPRVAPTAAVVGLLLAWVPCDASAAKPRDFGTASAGRPLHTATLATAQTSISNSPLCTAPFEQSTPRIIADGSGDDIVVWTDGRSGNLDIYAQKLTQNGSAVWVGDGLPICKDLANQASPRAISDGAGGAIVVWEDSRGTSKDIYAQRIDGFGTPLWTGNGVAVCNATGDQQAPVLVSDGVGGAIVAWTDNRGIAVSDVYAQRINGSGVAQWTANGVSLCAAAGVQQNLSIDTDGNHGAYVAWQDQRTDLSGDIYAIRVNATGVPQGTADGTGICVLPGPQETPVVVADGAGGVILGWADRRGANYDLYAQRFNSAVQWLPSGVPVCSALGDQRFLRACSDGAAGAVFAWQDGRGADADIYAQRLTPTGTPTWAVDGVAVCSAPADQVTPEIQRDPAGGALLTWADSRSATSGVDVYAQRINGSGVSQWSANGLQLCDAVNAQDTPVLVPDGVGGGLVAWHDNRVTYADLYAQPIDAAGTIGNQCAGLDTLMESVPQVLTAPQNYRTFNNQMQGFPIYFWTGVGVRSAPGSDWDIEAYDSGTFGQAAYPSCFGSSLAGSFSSGVVDLVMYDENENHTPPGVYGIRPFRYSGTGSGTVEWDALDNTIAISSNADPNHPVSSPAGWTGVLDVYDVQLTAGINYTFDFQKTPSDANLTLLLFSSVNSPDYYYVAPRSSRVFETTGRFYQYQSQATAYYGVAVVNETGDPASYTLKVWSDTPAVGVGSPPGSLKTGIESVSPNPAHGRAAIKFSLAQGSDVSFDVIDMAGRVVSRIPSRHWESGVWSIDWDGRSSGTSQLSTGVYFVQMQVNGRRMGLGRVALIQ